MRIVMVLRVGIAVAFFAPVFGVVALMAIVAMHLRVLGVVLAIAAFTAIPLLAIVRILRAWRELSVRAVVMKAKVIVCVRRRRSECEQGCAT